MPSETPYRIALMVVIVLTMAVTVYHRLQAAKSGEKISRRDEGYLFAIVLRLAGLCLWITTFGYLIVPASFQWAAMPLPAWVRWIGVIVAWRRRCTLKQLITFWKFASQKHCQGRTSASAQFFRRSFNL